MYPIRPQFIKAYRFEPLNLNQSLPYDFYVWQETCDAGRSPEKAMSA